MTVDDKPRLQKKLQKDADTAQYLHDTFRKFIPTQFIEHLTEGNAGELALGHAIEAEVAVMFLDIEGFSGLCEQMAPQQVLNFLNAFFTRMNSPIQLNHGFIDKFIGDAILALFDRPEVNGKGARFDALSAAIGIMQALDLYNQHRANSNYAPVKIGIGIHFGPVIIGTVGSHDRMDTTVIGDTVNIAQRLERLTRHYKHDIIVSKDMINKLPDSFTSHELGDETLKGKSQPTRIYRLAWDGN